jgi:hypothetical protein
MSSLLFVLLLLNPPEARRIQITTFGIELEMGDIFVQDFAYFVQECEGKNPADWIDNEKGFQEKINRYDQWYVTSDGTINNSNGTQSMFSHVDKNGITVIATDTRQGVDRSRWQGAELISPIFDRSQFEQFSHRLDYFISEAKMRGATFNPSLCHSFQVHVGLPDMTLEQCKSLLNEVFTTQDYWKSFRLKKAYNPITKKHTKAIIEAETFEELLAGYRLDTPEEDRFKWRKEVCLQPWLLHKLRGGNKPTLEFRVFPSTSNVSDLLTWIDLCLSFVENSDAINA